MNVKSYGYRHKNVNLKIKLVATYNSNINMVNFIKGFN
jgi:hypothetical protein